jgi:hypothetical protein
MCVRTYGSSFSASLRSKPGFAHFAAAKAGLRTFKETF